MSDLGMLLLFGGMALVAAWFVNFLVGLLRGEHPGDTGRVWLDILLRMFAIGEFGVLGRVLNYINASWARRILAGVGFIAIIVFLFRACHGDE
jgi:multidrug transporter EmrE-like cation transporter